MVVKQGEYIDFQLEVCFSMAIWSLQQQNLIIDSLS